MGIRYASTAISKLCHSVRSMEEAFLERKGKPTSLGVA
jgi:hypothetical protein